MGLGVLLSNVRWLTEAFGFGFGGVVAKGKRQGLSEPAV
jgi:hypothetical protein